ncbi:heat shock 70 kDa protein 17-like [Apium graveolens]|uniref:heat shock 70 kDa protein 17-like n=1 Tax=Apium graveolens TaxID=4045 RepID=UPI003D790324
MAKIALGLRLYILVSVLCFHSVLIESAVSSIDLGSESLKVAVVNLKPGQIPISIAINEMSKRKSPALVAFHSGNRLIGEEAAGLVARYPNKVFLSFRDLICKPCDIAKNALAKMYLPFDIVDDPVRNVIAINVNDSDDGIYSIEELVAMLLSYGSRLAESHAKVEVKDVVISVPPYFGQAERKGLMQAAEMAGINVLALVNEHSGAALQYGIDKDFLNESRNVVFYDMGSGSTYAALVHFSAYKTKEFGKTVSVNQFQVKDVRWNPELGGQDMELRLVEYFADEFNKQVGNGIDVRKSLKSMAKLKKQVKRTKEILSANTVAPISVESIYDDRDFKSSVTREKFEELCKDLWESSLIPLKEVLEHSGLQSDDLYAVELIGGATRVPKLQAKLQEFLGRKDLDRHLDADEAIVLGASLHAANLSDGIKLNRKLGMIDGAMYGYVFELDGPGLSKDETTRQLLVPRLKKLPSKMFRSIAHNKDFEVSLAYETEDLLPPGVLSQTFAHYVVSGLTDASAKYSAQNLSSPVKASLHFSLSRSGILSLDRADAVIEIYELVEVPKKNLTVQNSTFASPDVSAETSPQNASEESDDSVLSTGEGLGNSTILENDQNSTDIFTEKKLKKRTFRVPLKITEKLLLPGKSVSSESLAKSKSKLEILDKKDAERRRTEELKNNLEGYIYATKEKLDSDEFEKISSSQERQSFLEKLEQVQDWLYTDGEDASAAEFQQRLDSLKAIGDPIFFRYSELTARPEASQLARRYFDELQQIVQEWETKKSWLPRERIDEVLTYAEKVKSWLVEKEAEQKRTPVFSKPAFTSEELYGKVFDLQDKVASINRIPKPKPKVEKAVKNETEGNGEKTDDINSSSQDSIGSRGDETTNDSKVSTEESSNAEQSNLHDEL